MINAKILPNAGQRVGVVYGPGEFPRDNAGSVMCQIDDMWGSHVLVVMDNGEVHQCHGMNRGPGIGWHYVQPR